MSAVESPRLFRADRQEQGQHRLEEPPHRRADLRLPQLGGAEDARRIKCRRGGRRQEEPERPPAGVRRHGRVGPGQDPVSGRHARGPRGSGVSLITLSFFVVRISQSVSDRPFKPSLLIASLASNCINSISFSS
jgi:hypothetical protein